MTVYVITHKEFKYPLLPKEYKVLLVGANNKKNSSNYLTDNVGNNISSKNPSYCELTGLYWIWKHSTSANVGLVHYRRYFTNSHSQNSVALQQVFCGSQKPLSETKLKTLLNGKKWIVAAPQKFDPGYTIWSQFAEFHHKADLEKTRNIILQMSDKKYVKSFDEVMKRDYLSPYNMFYTRKKELDDYCNWLFPILFKLEDQVDISNYDSYQQRLFGFIAERLFNVYINATAKSSCEYVGVFNTQQNSRVDGARYFYRNLKSNIARK